MIVVDRPRTPPLELDARSTRLDVPARGCSSYSNRWVGLLGLREEGGGGGVCVCAKRRG